MRSFLSGKICLTLATIQNETNKKVIGKMKGEFSGTTVDYFLG